MTNKELVKVFKNTYSHNKDIEHALFELKNNGATQMDCLKIIKSELDLTISEADAIVLNSSAWADSKDKTVKLRDEFGKMLDNSSN